MAQLSNVIAGLPAGYDTRIGENGVRLSGGERRRLAIARAILRDAPILVLDEATADLDASTERALVASLRPFIAGRTTLVITHRPALIREADAVVEMRRGLTTPPPEVAAGLISGGQRRRHAAGERGRSRRIARPFDRPAARPPRPGTFWPSPAARPPMPVR